MKGFRERIVTAGAFGAGMGALGALFLVVPLLLLALGLWLVGVPIDWSSWKTYVGLFVLWLAVA